ncbi:hypothetical protein KKF11_00375 [Patescibacteria group bacterium]|nr:hypothetical protein [Patescibacteria group bacterium]
MAFNMRNIGNQGKMAAKAIQIQRQLAKKKIVLEEDNLRVVVTADMKVRSVEIDGEDQKDLVKLLNKAIRQSQMAMADMPQLSDMLSGLRR